MFGICTPNYQKAGLVIYKNHKNLWTYSVRYLYSMWGLQVEELRVI